MQYPVYTVHIHHDTLVSGLSTNNSKVCAVKDGTACLRFLVLRMLRGTGDSFIQLINEFLDLPLAMICWYFRTLRVFQIVRRQIVGWYAKKFTETHEEGKPTIPVSGETAEYSENRQPGEPASGPKFEYKT
jgi:hypothetical protein